MENTPLTDRKALLKITATYGAYLGAALVAISFADYLLNIYGGSTLINTLSYAVFIGGIVWATLAYRNNAKGGYISYGQALRFGTALCAFAAVILGAYTAILVNVVDPAYLEKSFEVAMQQMADSGEYTEDEIDLAMSASRAMMTPVSIVVFSVITYSLLGFFVSLITSAFIKKEKN
ncbi:MAG: DUF4199 domain-containing protein [Prevotellaceae bacterium]|jgi:hypothetical protein|nr:DUF4199 domain-containing protein [Prevotellaceae bacterium]